MADLSLGRARVYGDDLMPVGARVEVDLVIPGGPAVEVHARVVRVSMLPPTGPAFCAVALQFVGMPDDAKCLLADWLGVPRSAPALHSG